MTRLRESLEKLCANPEPYVRSGAQAEHRLGILRLWLEIAESHGLDLCSKVIGKQTLDIGCGQGDMIEAFAALLKVDGHPQSMVIGVDPGSLDYGSPWTLCEAQAHYTSGPLSSHLSFQQSTAHALVDSAPPGTYSAAYFAHSLYYFPSAAAALEDFRSLRRSGVEIILVAEWALRISRLSALPHLLSVLLQSMEPLFEDNIRTALLPATYIDLANQAGWELVASHIMTPSESLEDGRWEATFAREVADKTKDEQRRALLQGSNNSDLVHLTSLRTQSETFEASLASQSGVDEIHCMDVWLAAFRPAG